MQGHAATRARRMVARIRCCTATKGHVAGYGESEKPYRHTRDLQSQVLNVLKGGDKMALQSIINSSNLWEYPMKSICRILDITFQQEFHSAPIV